MKTTFHPATARGHADHGWLDTYHSFSFAGYSDPGKVHFGMLRVLNDDTVIKGKGFGTHSHDNMEIISIPLTGTLEHRDSMNTLGTIGPNDVQAMSAGTGIMHSEYNHSASEPVSFLQIWIFPKVRDIEPRYSEMRFDPAMRRNKLQRLVTPLNDASESVKINQDAYLSRTELEAGKQLDYKLNQAGNGIYVFVLKGAVLVADHQLGARDALAIEHADALEMIANQDADVLFIEIPMN
jgi:hypothetical protein